MTASRTLLLAGLGLAVALASVAGDTGRRAMAQDREMDRLRLQLQDCSGPSCVSQRDRLISQLRDRTRNCSGDACDAWRIRLRDQQRLRACDAAGDPCAALRHEIRQREQKMLLIPGQGGSNRGGGMGGGKGGKN